jgi:hypothetical protein
MITPPGRDFPARWKIWEQGPVMGRIPPPGRDFLAGGRGRQNVPMKVSPLVPPPLGDFLTGWKARSDRTESAATVISPPSFNLPGRRRPRKGRQRLHHSPDQSAEATDGARGRHGGNYATEAGRRKGARRGAAQGAAGYQLSVIGYRVVTTDHGTTDHGLPPAVRRRRGRVRGGPTDGGAA